MHPHARAGCVATGWIVRRRSGIPAFQDVDLETVIRQVLGQTQCALNGYTAVRREEV